MMRITASKALEQIKAGAIKIRDRKKTAGSSEHVTTSNTSAVETTRTESSKKSLTTRKREVPSDFDIVAGTYDTLVTRNPGYIDHLKLSATRLDLPNNGEGARILDLCCGTGLSTEAVVAAFPKATVVGLDASGGMLDLARKKKEMAAVTFVLGDAMNPGPALELAHVGGPFDGILMAYGIRNMPDADACLAAIKPMLKPGAPICFHEYSVADSPRAKGTWTTVAWGIIIPSGLITSRHTRIYRYLWKSVMQFDGKRAFEQRLRNAGFDNVHTEPMDGWQKDIVHSFLANAPK
jgi:ubiquinone/menaquinone biosynthesis C-methylase UbiE